MILDLCAYKMGWLGKLSCSCPICGDGVGDWHAVRERLPCSLLRTIRRQGRLGRKSGVVGTGKRMRTVGI